MSDQFRGFNIPIDADKIMDEAVQVFNEGIEDCLSVAVHGRFPGTSSTYCQGWWCDACIHGCRRRDNAKAFAEYARSLGYTITKKGFEMDRKETFTITVKPLDQYHADLLQTVVHGWESILSMRREEYNNVFEIYADGYEQISLTVNVTRLQEKYVDVDELYDNLLELKRLLHLAFPSGQDVTVVGELVWEHGDHIHIIRGEGHDLVLATKDKVKEMTVDQISKALGYTVKVVGEEK